LSANKDSEPTELCLEYQGRSIRTQSDAATAEWLREFFCPAFQVAQSTTPDWTVSLHSDPTRPVVWNKTRTPVSEQEMLEEERLNASPADQLIDCFSLDGRFTQHRILRRERSYFSIRETVRAIEYEIDRRERQVRVTVPEHPRLHRLTLMRVVRELATIQAQNRQMLPIHGAAFRVENRAYILTGPKKSGKTTTLLRALQSPEASFISNDRLIVSAGEVPRVFGMPTFISVRADTWKLLPDFYQQFRDNPWEHDETLSEGRRRVQALAADPDAMGGDQLLPFKASLTTAQFCELARTTPTPATTLTSDVEVGAIIFPRVSNRVATLATEKIPPEIAAQRLFEEGLMLPGPVLLTAEAFRLDTDCVETPTAKLLELCRQLTLRVPCYSCEVGPLMDHHSFLAQARNSFAA